MERKSSKSAYRASAASQPIDRRLPILLRRAWFGLNQAFRRSIAKSRLTPGQYTALRTLVEAGEMSQRELTGLMSSDANTIASLLSRMETLGWVKRESHELDRRANRLRVTAKGRRKFEAARPQAMELQQRVLGTLSKAEQAAFLESMEKIADACQRTLRLRQ
jgi:DNA-binding MarR family transcriptional regulator